MKIEGLARNVGTHAAAVVIADKPLVEYVPLGRVQGKDEVITQWAMGDVEAAGLLKMDFLGLRNLTILAKAVELDRADDRPSGSTPTSFRSTTARRSRCLCRGETKGIFQLESGGIRDLLQKMKPDHFRDIIATNALYRPGPLEGGMVDDYVQVKHGRKEAEYPHPVMKEVLEETHGVMVYQEQVMRILNRLGGIALSDAYTCIKAISKKKLPMIAKYREEFVAGADGQGPGEAQADELFEMIEKFAGYGFNKSHSTAYALIAYMTAYLKAHYPGRVHGGPALGRHRRPQFQEEGRAGRAPGRLPADGDRGRAARRQPLATPISRWPTARFYVGLCAIKGCGTRGRRGARRAHAKAGRSATCSISASGRSVAVVSRATIETLIKAGAFDFARRPALAKHGRARSGPATRRRCARRSPQRPEGPVRRARRRPSRRPRAGRLPDMPEWDDRAAAGRRKRSARLLSHQPSAGRARKDAGHLLLAHDRRRRQPRASHRGRVGRHACRRSSFRRRRTPAPARPTPSTRCSTWRTPAARVRCILWPEEFANHGHLFRPTPRWSCAAPSIAGRAATSPT